MKLSGRNGLGVLPPCSVFLPDILLTEVDNV